MGTLAGQDSDPLRITGGLDFSVRAARGSSPARALARHQFSEVVCSLWIESREITVKRGDFQLTRKHYRSWSPAALVDSGGWSCSGFAKSAAAFWVLARQGCDVAAGVVRKE